MKNRIKVLPEFVANQIAAGEVVQRPASAVKELLENAIDAGSKQITLNIRDAGKTLIQVIDDGTGMTETDARLCVERHATSKISVIDDLFHIRTMGFRGEALASIVAVSQFELRTRTAEDELATVIRMNGAEVVSHESRVAAPGTSVSVGNLFFNVPARRSFLKNDSIENRHIAEVFQQIALTDPSISFTYINNEEEVYRISEGNFRKRIVQLFGKKFDERLIPVEEETDIVRISGFVCKPEFATARRSEQFFIVNGRFIRSPYLHHAVMAAFEELLPRELQAQYFINLQVDPSKIDVNIHPTKTEIKFLEERSIYAILRTTIRLSLGKYNISPTLDFERETAFDITFDKNKEIKIPEIRVNHSFDPFRTGSVKFSQKAEEVIPGSTATVRQQVDLETALGTMAAERTAISPTEPSRLIQAQNRFILANIKSGFLVIDQKRAHRRIIYEELLKSKDSGQAGQSLLFPVMIEINPADLPLVKELIPELSKAGFSLEEFGGNSFTVNSMPNGCSEKELQAFFHALIEDYKMGKMSGTNTPFEKLADVLSSRIALKSNQSLNETEMQNLIDRLFACEMPYSLPNGKAIVMTISLDELERKFQ